VDVRQSLDRNHAGHRPTVDFLNSMHRRPPRSTVPRNKFALPSPQLRSEKKWIAKTHHFRHPLSDMVSSELESDIFISYTHADAEWVRMLAARIESETVDGTQTGRRLRVFFAEWDITAGQNIVNRINEGLEHARFVVLVMSPEFFDSAWCNVEWTHMVSRDPANKAGRILPLHRHSTLLKAPLNAWNWLDFRSDERFEIEFHRLINAVREEVPTRGPRTPPTVAATATGSVLQTSSWKPDAVTEVLISNLLPVTHLPTEIWSASTEMRKATEVFEVVERPDVFLLRDGKLYTFARLTAEGCSLREVVDAATISPSPERTDTWLAHRDKKLWLMALLNECLSQHMRGLPTWKQSRGRYFFPPEDGGIRRWKNPGDQSREVAAPKATPDGGVFWVHHSVFTRFTRFGDRFFVLLVPGFTFTSDGSMPLAGKSMGRLSVQWGGRQKNPDVLRSVMFWAKALATGGNEIRIQAGADTILASPLPATTKTAVGIQGDHIQIAALLNTAEAELDEVAAEIDLVEIETESPAEAEEGDDET
jgi:TIR domain-containing protein